MNSFLRYGWLITAFLLLSTFIFGGGGSIKDWSCDNSAYSSSTQNQCRATSVMHVFVILAAFLALFTWVIEAYFALSSFFVPHLLAFGAAVLTFIALLMAYSLQYQSDWLPNGEATTSGQLLLVTSFAIMLPLLLERSGFAPRNVSYPTSAAAGIPSPSSAYGGGGAPQKTSPPFVFAPIPTAGGGGGAAAASGAASNPTYENYAPASAANTYSNYAPPSVTASPAGTPRGAPYDGAASQTLV